MTRPYLRPRPRRYTVFMRPTFDVPYPAIGMLSSPRTAHGMLVAHSISSSSRRPYTNWCRSQRYWTSSQVCANGGVTSSISASE